MRYKEVPGTDSIIENPNFNRQTAARFQEKLLDSKPYGLGPVFHVRFDVADNLGLIKQRFLGANNRSDLPKKAVNVEEFNEGEIVFGPYTGKDGQTYIDVHTHDSLLTIHGSIPISHKRVDSEAK